MFDVFEHLRRKLISQDKNDPVETAKREYIEANTFSHERSCFGTDVQSCCFMVEGDP